MRGLRRARAFWTAPARREARMPRPSRSTRSNALRLYSSLAMSWFLSERRVADGLQRLVVIPLRQEQLTSGPPGPARCPGKRLSVGRRHGQAVEAIGVGHPHRFLRPRRIDDEELEVF